MKIALYARVSTENKGQNPENQLQELRSFAAAQGWEITREYVDYMTGSSGKRPEFQAMLKDASEGRFELVCFWSLDRLTREGTVQTLNYLTRLQGYGVKYRSLTESYIDSAGIFGDVIIALLSTLAKQERIRISQRTKAGLTLARSRGARLGHAPADIDHQEWANLRSQGLSGRECARRLGWHESTLRRHARASGIVSRGRSHAETV